MKMRNYVETLKLLLNRLLLIMAAYTLTRFFFYIFNTEYFRVDCFTIFIAFLAGLRFDISAILYTNFLFILLHILPGGWKNHRFVQKSALWIFVTVNAIFLLLNFGDIKYFSFINKRSTWDIFYLVQASSDVWDLIPSFLSDYWYVILLWGTTTYALFRFYPCKNKGYEKIKVSAKSMTFQTTAFVAIFTLFTIGARGGLQLRPINMLTAVQYLKPDKVALVTNSTFTMINSYTSDRFDAYHFFSNEELSHIFTPEQMYIPPTPSVTRKNVVILILESFGAEYSAHLSGNTKGYTPFLDSLMQQSYYFTRAYANGKKSMEALPAIISGIPALMENPYITSPFSSNVIMSIPLVLEEFNYETYFFHGGANGTMGFDNFSKAAGIDNYMGINEYVGRKADFDGHWGIFDEPYLQYVVDVLDTVKSPFFAGVFTLSSHHPYKVPAEYAGKFPNGEFPILESVAYADYALQRFFERASKSTWYKNTLFVLTADHTAQSYSPKFSNVHGNYRVPLIFFDPSNKKLSGMEKQVVQHTDIFPSVVRYLNIQEPVVSYGTSVFERDTGWTVSYLNNVYQLVTDSLLLQFDGENLIGIYQLATDSLLRENIAENYKTGDLPELIFLKALIQDYRYRMINNRLTAKWPVKRTK